MRTLFRSACVCIIATGLAASASGQEAAIVECQSYPERGVSMAVRHLSMSAPSDLGFEATPSPAIECADAVAAILSAGYAMVSTYTDIMGSPTYTFVRPAPGRSATRSEEEVFFVGCRPWPLGFGDFVFFASSTAGGRTLPTGEASDCAGALAGMMREGFSLIHAGGGNYGDGVLYTLYRGGDGEILEPGSFSPGPGTMAASVRCKRSWNGHDFVVNFSEAAFGGPTIGGEGVDCADEISLLLEEGYRIADIRIGPLGDSMHLTLITGGRPVRLSASRRGRDQRRQDGDVAILFCYAVRGIDKSVIYTASTSSRVLPLSGGSMCQPALASLLSSGFEVLDVGADREADFALYTLFSPSHRGRDNKGR